MARTAQTPITPSQLKRPAQAEARRLRMSPALLQLEERILGMLLAQKGKPISLREIEETLASGGNRVDTFEVRDAVWRLIDKRKADFTPLRDVMAVGA